MTSAVVIIKKAMNLRVGIMTESTENSLGLPATEARNPATHDLDNLSAVEIIKLMNSEDEKVAAAVGAVADDIASAVELIVERLSAGGRLVYAGAGTSGRLGVLDAVECPPTFNTAPELVVGVMAGGPDALLRAVEGVEDSARAGRADMQQINLGNRDVVVGIAASGRTPYVIGALDYARETGAGTIAFSCNPEPRIQAHADLSIIPVVGPEVLSGSTRLKAGTATKMVLNMLTTAAMVRLGKTYSNLMVDLRATNLKLTERARRIVQILANCSSAEADELLQRSDGEVKTAIVADKLGISPAQARGRLDAVQGHLRLALEE
jgi:N-acetylmuramic acid 6-phosphate etherase